MSASTFEAPKIGDGEQIGDGNVQETLNIGRVNQPVQIGNSTGGAGSIGFYGKTPAVQRASSVQAASVVSASSYISVPANLAAWAAEVNATLTGLGLWKGTA